MTCVCRDRLQTAVSWIACLGAVFLATISSAVAEDRTVQVTVTDSVTNKPLPVRAYLHRDDGTPYYFSSSDPSGSAVRYEKKNWINARSSEYHTTLSAHPFQAKVPSGNYTLVVEHGKSYRSFRKDLEIATTDLKISVALERWCDPATRGWFSGDTHIHRTIDELQNVVLAEDLNVALPLTNWVTKSGTPPSAGDKSIDDARRTDLVAVDATHVIWPRNTEYEIFTVGKKQHTLGALFVLGHRGLLEGTVPPWKPVVAELAKSEPQALFDMDKLDWPFAMLLPTIAPQSLYELSNNHTWRTEFAFRDWNTPAPLYLQPPYGGKTGDHRAWLDYTHGMYYTLLNCGLRLPPSAGTANGVHPVPAGFGRVYVHLPNGFEFGAWMEGLRRGRSFVTTGPMLYATADGHDPGKVFELSSKDEAQISLDIELESEERLLYAELIVNGVAEQLIPLRDQQQAGPAYRSKAKLTLQPQRSGWFAIRAWENRPDGRIRFAHSAPWYVEVDHQPVRIARTEKRYLVERMQREIERSRDVVGDAALREYQEGLAFYEGLPEIDDSGDIARQSRPVKSDAERKRWLDNMILDHRFDADEVRMATGLSLDEATREVAARAEARDNAVSDGVRLRPYPGGRHPRRGFLDGAIDPQRETKISVFPPWKEGGYVVVDVPEAIFSNLGLTYLAHTHIPTIWDQQRLSLEKLEWTEESDGLSLRRKLPNGIEFTTRVVKRNDGVDMKIDLTNGTGEPLTGLRVQVCTMLKGAVGFNAQEPLVSRIDESVIAVRAAEADRWIITSWQPLHRVWQNPPVPCIHADPVFPDCQPGKTVSIAGKLRFYEGADVKQAMEAAR
jgi:hypothetical protein